MKILLNFCVSMSAGGQYCSDVSVPPSGEGSRAGAIAVLHPMTTTKANTAFLGTMSDAGSESRSAESA